MNSTYLWSKGKRPEEIMTLFESIIKMSQDGIYVCDREGRTLLVNEALIDITKIDKETFYQYRLHELIEKGILPKSCAYQTLKTKKTHNMIINYYNGKKAILTSTPVFDKHNDIFCVVSNVRDITELNFLQEKLEESHRKNIEYEELLFKGEWLFHEFESDVVYRSPQMKEIISLADRFSKNDSPVLLLGESGVGKDVIAQYIHNKSERAGDFVRVNCGAIPENLLESELFGHEKGAFTGADVDRQGLFELAHQGTIFLDEIGDMPYDLQVKLLNVLQERKIRRIGGEKLFSIDIRVIAATNVDLSDMVAKKQFRQDLYYRLNVLPINIPPLRERKDDISLLTFYFLNKLNKKYNQSKKIEPEVLRCFMAYNWPGNVRELNNITERMYHMSDTDTISLNLLPQSIRDHRQPHINNIQHLNETDYTIPLKDAVQQFEKIYITQIIRKSPTLSECARQLNISLSTLMRRKKQYNID